MILESEEKGLVVYLAWLVSSKSDTSPNLQTLLDVVKECFAEQTSPEQWKATQPYWVCVYRNEDADSDPVSYHRIYDARAPGVRTWPLCTAH